MRRLLLILSVCITYSLMGQDTQYSQFYANPLYLNPAFAGTGNNTRVAINHRLLWPSLPQTFASYAASIDYKAAKINSGFGLQAYSDVEGSASLKTSSMSLIYSYEANFNNKFVFRPALQMGYVFRTIDRSKFVFGDQIDFGVDGAPSQDPNINGLKMKDYLDIGSGFLIYNRKYWFGASAQHLTQPNRSFLEDNDRLRIRYSFHAGGRFPVGSIKTRGQVLPTLAPSILYKRQGNFQQLDAGGSIHLQPVILGLYYRGMPFFSKAFNQINQDAVIVQIGLEYFNLEFGYSYDMNISGLGISGGGAHELALQYNFKFPVNPRHVPRSKKILECPAFIHRLDN